MFTTRGPGIAIRQASLLYLPRELRLQIYVYVFGLDLEHIIFHPQKTRYTEDEAKSAVGSNQEQDLMIPWLNLMLSCKTLAFELRPSIGDISSRTYVLDMEAAGRGKYLGRTVWRHLPCAPTQAEYLEIHFNTSRGFRAWGCRGQHPIVSGLYQTLNHLIHCGPNMFVSKKTLPQPMHLKELRMFIKSNEENTKNAEDYTLEFDRDTDPETAAISLGTIFSQIYQTSVLNGYVDNIRINSCKHALHWVINETVAEGIPDEWSGYGFEWGV